MTPTEKLAEFRNLVPKVKQAAEEAAAIVQRIENWIDPELTVPAEVAIRNALDNTCLTWQRVDGEFRIAIRTTVQDDEELYVAFEDAPRDLQLLAFPSVPVLLGGIMMNAQQAIKEFEAARALVEKYLELVPNRE